VFEIEIEFGLTALKTMCKNLEVSIKVDFSKLGEKINSNINYNQLSSFEKEQYDTHFYDFEKIVLKNLTRQTRYAAILSIFSFFEGELKRICELIESTFNLNEKIKDIKAGTDLLMYRKYLSKIFGADLSKIMSFDFVNKQKKIRNRIAHYSGIINEKEQIEGLNFQKKGDVYQIDPEVIYVKNLIDTITDCLYNVLLAVDMRYINLHVK
jgi:hypothetical protein